MFLALFSKEMIILGQRQACMLKEVKGRPDLPEHLLNQ